MKEKEEREKEWRKQRGDKSSDEDEEEEGSGSSASDSEEKEGEAASKSKGPQDLVDVENPNRIVTKAKKVALLDVTTDVKTELSRKEREELEKQRARANYLKLHAEGKTDEAQADLARLAIIRKQREEAAKKREEEKQARDAAKAAKTESTNKALGKGKKT